MGVLGRLNRAGRQEHASGCRRVGIDCCAMAVVTLRAPLKDRADGQGQFDLPGDSLGEVLRELERRYPRLEGWVLDEHGSIRRHVNVFVDGERGRADTPVTADAVVHVLPSISGGSGS